MSRKNFGTDPSPKQKAVLLYGQRLRGLGSVGELIKHLHILGYPRSAEAVHRATQVLKVAAKTEYERKRKELDPTWEAPWDKLLQEILAEDAAERELKLKEKGNERDTTSETSSNEEGKTGPGWRK
jgi:hypothetical protein